MWSGPYPFRILIIYSLFLEFWNFKKKHIGVYSMSICSHALSFLFSLFFYFLVVFKNDFKLISFLCYLECYWIRHWTFRINSSCFIFSFPRFLFLFFILGNSFDFVFQTFHWSFNFGNISKSFSLLFDCSSFIAFCFCSIYSTSPFITLR